MGNFRTAMQNEVPVNEDLGVVLYFAPDEGEEFPEFLFFPEEIIRESGWKKASRKGKQIWNRIRDAYESSAIDLFATDRFVRRLRSFKKVTVFLNKPIEPSLVKKRLRQIFRDRSYHHLRWMIIDALLLPVSLITVPLPGPNVFGYYLMFRVYSHWKSYRSASNTPLDEVDVRVNDQANDVNTFLRKSKDIRSALRELRQKYGLRAVQEEKFIPQMEMAKEIWSRLKHHFLKSSDHVTDL